MHAHEGHDNYGVDRGPFSGLRDPVSGAVGRTLSDQQGQKPKDARGCLLGGLHGGVAIIAL